MKKYTYLLAIAALFALAVIPSCKKEQPLKVETSTQSPGRHLLQDVKDWYQQQLALPSSVTDGAIDVKVYTPDWDKAKVVKNSKRQNVVGVPLFSSKEVYMELNVLVADGKPVGIVKKYVLDADKKVELSIYSISGELISKGYYDGKRRVFMSASPKDKVMGDGVGGGGGKDPILLEEVVIAINPSEDGSGGDSFPSFPVGGRDSPANTGDFNMTDPGYNDGGDPSYDGGSAEQPVEEPKSVVDIINNIKDPCLKGMVDDIISKDATTKIGSMIYKIFNESTYLKLFFNESATLPNLTGAETKPKIDDYGNFTGTIEINFNVNTLPNASKEYIALVTLHEGLHAYLNSNNNHNGRIHHEAMAIIYLDEMAKSLTEMFPDMPRGDAYSLAYEGLRETLTFELNVNSVPQLPDTYASINQQYRLAQKGSKCK